MKRIIPYLFLAAIALTGCSDFLDQQNPNKIAAEDYFKTENDVFRALNGAYLAIRDNGCLGETSSLYTEERSDNTGRTDNQSSSGEPFQFTDFSLLPSNTYIKTHWSKMYNAISRANFVLTYMDQVSFADASQKEIYRSEALFLRALVYFHVVRKWGDAPLINYYLTTEKEIDEHTRRRPRADIYDQIIGDLKAALNSNLPDIQPLSGKGRASKAAINGLLGQVYLTRARNLATSVQEELINARTYLLAAYGMRTFGSLSEIPYEEVFDVAHKSTCPEIIFQIVYNQGDMKYHSSVASNNQPRNEYVNSQKKSTSDGANFVNPDIVNEYEADDLRKAWSVCYANTPKAHYITKFRDTSDAAGTLGYGGNDWILMRYADIILMLAEVNAYLGDESEAIAYLDEVRARANRPLYADMRRDETYNTRYPSLGLAILHERRVELAFENHRWFDLLRFFTPEELVNFMRAKKQDDYGISQLSNFGTKDVFYPIPFDEWKLNPEKMYQNAGY